MVSTRKKKQQNNRLLSQLFDGDTDFMIGQSNQDAQTDKRDTVSCRRTSPHKTSNLSQVDYSQVDMHTLEEVSKVRGKVDHVIITVETRVQDVVLTAKKL